MPNEVTVRIASDELLQCDITRRLNDQIAAQNKTGFPLNTNFPSPQDVKILFALLQDYSRFFFPQIPYKRLLTTEQKINNIHGEIAEVQKRWSDIFLIRAYAIPTMVTQPLTQFGIEDARKVDLLITTPDLLAAGMATQDAVTLEVTPIRRAGIGDHFWYHTREYDVNTFVPAAFFANTDLPLYYQLKAELYREPSVDTFGPHCQQVVVAHRARVLLS